MASSIYLDIGDVFRLGIRSDGVRSASIRVLRYRIRVVSLAYICCIDMGRGTLRIRVSDAHVVGRLYLYRSWPSASTAGPATFAAMLREHSNVTFSGPLSFLNDWCVMIPISIHTALFTHTGHTSSEKKVRPVALSSFWFPRTLSGLTPFGRAQLCSWSSYLR